MKKPSETHTIAGTPKSTFFYGYIIVFICFIIMVFGWGIYSIYGVFFRSIEAEFGWTRAVTSGAFSLSVLMSGISGLAAGRLSDRFGPRIVIMVCTTFLAAGYALMSLIQNTWQFYLVYILLIGTGIGGLWIPPLSTVARWFTARRGIMTGIVSAGVSFAILVAPLITTRLIDSFGWQRSYLIISFTLLIVIMISVQFLRRSPQQMGLAPYGASKIQVHKPGPGPVSFSLGEAVRTRQFWMVSVIYLCYGIICLALIVHIVPHVSALGNSDITSAGVLSVIGGFSLAGRIIMGSVADRLKVKISTVLCLSFMTISLAWLLFANELWQLYIFAAVYGIGYGGLSALQSVIGAELFGVASLGAITAVFSLNFNIGGAIGPVLAGYIFDISESYRWAFLVCLIVIAIALGISLSLKPPRKK